MGRKNNDTRFFGIVKIYSKEILAAVGVLLALAITAIGLALSWPSTLGLLMGNFVFCGLMFVAATLLALTAISQDVRLGRGPRGS